jgi:hypothetical protein
VIIKRKELPKGWENAQFEKLLGTGAYGVVMGGTNQAINPKTQEVHTFDFAVKVLQYSAQKEAEGIKNVGSKWGYRLYAYTELSNVTRSVTAFLTPVVSFIFTNKFQMTLFDYALDYSNRFVKALPSIQKQMYDQMAFHWLKTGKLVLDRHANNWMVSFDMRRQNPRVYMIDIDVEAFSKETNMKENGSRPLWKRWRGSAMRVPTETQKDIQEAIEGTLKGLQNAINVPPQQKQ